MLQLRGAVSVLAKSGHAPQACKNKSKVPATSYMLPRSKNGKQLKYIKSREENLKWGSIGSGIIVHLQNNINNS